MIPGLTDELLTRLVDIGCREAFDELARVPADFPEVRSGQIMRRPFQEWYEVARRLSCTDVVSLIRALTVAERDLPNFRCGSVSPVISLYRFLLDSSSEDFSDLRGWVLANTQNPYLPFGSMRYQPATLAEYFRLTADHEARRRAREQANAEAQALMRAARQQKRDAQAAARLLVRESRAALINSLQSLTPVERLKWIVGNADHPVTFYPDEWAVIDLATIKSLDPELRLAVVRRLADRRTGIWKKLREQLESGSCD